MKQLIKDVLEDVADSQPNLNSEAARENIATSIISVIKAKGSYIEFTDSEIDEQKMKDSWVCSICGKSTYDVDYDYLVHPKLHLGCALEEEAKGKDIKEQYLEASEKYFNDDIPDETIFKFRNTAGGEWDYTTKHEAREDFYEHKDEEEE